MTTLYLEGGCFALNGCSSYSEEWLTSTNTAILQCFADHITEPHTIINASKHLRNGDNMLSYTITYTHSKPEEVMAFIPLYREWLDEIIPCDHKDNLYSKRRNPETKLLQTRPPNYPHLIISSQTQKAFLFDGMFGRYTPDRRRSLSPSTSSRL